MGNWSKVEYICTTKLGINMLVLDQLEHWRVEQILENYKLDLEEQKKERDRQEKEQLKQMGSSNSSGQGAHKNPKIPPLNVPKLNIPKYY